VSPDGRWLAYSAKEGRGRFEIFVQPFPAGEAKWQVSHGGGTQPQWSRDGRELFYMSSDRKLMAVAVKGGAADFTPGEPRTLVTPTVVGRDGPNAMGAQYAVTGDGQRFLISVASSDAAPITLILNWTAATR
jgi:Tol biopolymer transport system component